MRPQIFRSILEEPVLRNQYWHDRGMTQRTSIKEMASVACEYGRSTARENHRSWTCCELILGDLLGNADIDQHPTHRFFAEHALLFLRFGHRLSNVAEPKTSKFACRSKPVRKFKPSDHRIEKRQHAMLQAHRLFGIARTGKLKHPDHPFGYH